jgi:hypothetical protein
MKKILLALNLIFVLVIVALLVRQSKTPPPQIVTPVVSNETRAAVAPAKPRSYASLATDADWRQWIEMLRELGVPTRVLARLAREGFDDRWQKHHDETYTRYMKGEVDTEELAALGIEHDLKQEEAIRAALGEADFREWDLQNVMQSISLREIQLTAAETNALYELESNHRRRLNELLLSKLRGETDQATLDQRQEQAQADHDAQLKAMLGEQRYAKMEGVDDSAGELQRSLTDVALPADVSFESLLAMQNKWIERRSDMEAGINEARSQMSNFEQELKRMDDMREREFLRVLGTNTFDALEKGQDARYREMKRYADAWGLDDTTTDYVYRTIQYYEKAVGDYQIQARALEAQGQAVDWDGVSQNVREFAQLTGQALRKYLGDNRFDIVKSNGILPFAPARQ